MNKTELIEALAYGTGITKGKASEVLDTLVDVIGEKLAQGQDVAILGFGTFTVSKRSERIGRNPATGEAIMIPESKVVKFRPGKNLRDAVR